MSGRYRKFPVATWGKTFFRTLSAPKPNAQTLWVFFVTGPLTVSIPGLVIAGEAALAEALSWPLPKFRRAFRELEAQQLAQADWGSRVVWIPSVLDDNPPESPNVLRAWRSAFDELPDCPVTAQARATVEAMVEGLTEPFRKAFAEGSRKTFDKTFGKSFDETLPNQKQKTEAEAETGAGVSPLPPSHTAGQPRAARNGRPMGKRVSDAWRGARA